MKKYGTFVVYKCSKCGVEKHIPKHMEDNPPLEKYAHDCTHEWEKVGYEEHEKEG